MDELDLKIKKLEAIARLQDKRLELKSIKLDRITSSYTSKGKCKIINMIPNKRKI